MIQRDPQKVFRETRHECLKSTTCDKQLNQEVILCLRYAMLNTSMMGLGVELDTYKRLVLLKEGFNLFEIEYILKILLSATPNELGQNLRQNLEFIEEELIPLRDSFCEIDDEISKKIAAEINAKIALQENIPDKKKLFIPNRRIIGVQ